MAPVQTPAVVEKMAKLNLHITDFHLAADEEKGIVLTWKRCKDAEMYQIYRASKKKGTYHMIQAVSGGKTKYVDEKAKSEKCYYYKIRALGNSNGERQQGEWSKVRSARVFSLKKPKVIVRKGRLDAIRYISIDLKQYEGVYAEVYISLSQNKFKKLKLTSNKISKYQGQFKIQCMVKNKDIFVKVRTYKKQGKKKLYSDFSKVKKIRV